MVKVTGATPRPKNVRKVKPAQSDAVDRKERDLTRAEDTPDAKDAPAEKKVAAEVQFAKADARNDPFEKVKPEALAVARAAGVTF